MQGWDSRTRRAEIGPAAATGPRRAPVASPGSVSLRPEIWEHRPPPSSRDPQAPASGRWAAAEPALGIATPALGMAAREELYSKVTPRRDRLQRPGTVKHGSALDVLLSMGFPRARA